MPKRIRLRALAAEEKVQIQRLAASRKESIRLVQRARIIAAMVASPHLRDEDPELTATEAGLRAGFKSNAVGPMWVKRFNEEGVAGLQDRPRPGRKPVHSQEVRSALICLALQKPRSLGYPFELWTLERLQRAFEERHGVHLSDRRCGETASTIWTWMGKEGFKSKMWRSHWKRQQSLFHEAKKHDPEFVEKRGA